MLPKVAALGGAAHNSPHAWGVVGQANDVVMLFKKRYFPSNFLQWCFDFNFLHKLSLPVSLKHLYTLACPGVPGEHVTTVRARQDEVRAPPRCFLGKEGLQI